MSSPTTFEHEEGKWQEALCRMWREGLGLPWRRLLTCQIVQATHPDLLGMSPDHLPMVVVLKTAQATDTPVQMLIQATACALALRQAWSHGFRTTWARVAGLDADGLPERLRGSMLVCAASADYWAQWTDRSARAESLGPAAWAAVADLRRALQRNGFPSTFLKLEHQGVDECGLPTAIRAIEQRLPIGCASDALTGCSARSSACERRCNAA
jgi:hypothetical protein